MLKYIGEFEKLKDYGFTITYNKNTGKINYCRYENKLHLRNHHYEIDVNVITKILTTRLFCSSSLDDSHGDIENVFEDMLYDLIKNGLIKKVDI